MKSRPILFSTPMVRALLAGRKTQTRRTINFHPDFGTIQHWQYLQPLFGLAGGVGPPFGDWHQWCRVGPDYPDDHRDHVRCPWAVGQDLWVRETWADAPLGTYFRANENCWPPGIRWRPSIFMPKARSRITLRITNVRAQQLQEISDADAVAEGIIRVGKRWEAEGIAATPISAVDAYRALWDYLNGQGSWHENPWVWVLEFQRVEAPPLPASAVVAVTAS